MPLAPEKLEGFERIFLYVYEAGMLLASYTEIPSLINVVVGAPGLFWCARALGSSGDGFSFSFRYFALASFSGLNYSSVRVWPAFFIY